MKTWQLDAQGWLTGVRHLPSPNCDARPQGELPSLVIVHAISLPPDEFGGEGVCELFTNRLDAKVHPYYASIAELRVSAHFFVRRDGDVWQFVSVLERAWHAGVSAWQGRQRCNDFSLGIELEGCDSLPFTDHQYLALNALLTSLGEQLPLIAVVGHSDVAPGRKTDPGPCFEWHRVVYDR